MVHYSIGLTGGIGSGKSAVADALATHGAGVIDTDAIAHQLTAADGGAIDIVRKTFGDEFILSSGAMDRSKMRALVFADESARRSLQNVLHPMIRACAESAATQAGSAPYLVFVVPLLVESKSWIERVNRVLVVDCSAATQVQRVRQRSGLSEADVLTIIARQTDRRSRLHAADDVIFNEGSLADLTSHADRVHRLYFREARAPSL